MRLEGGHQGGSPLSVPSGPSAVNADDLAELTRRDLEPLLAATATIDAPTVNRRVAGGRQAPGNTMWISVPGGLEVTLTRSLPLSTWEAGILRPYGNALRDLHGIPDAVARNAADEVVLRAIAVQLGDMQAAIVEAAIRFLLRAAVSTYEGQPIHLNVLVDLALPPAPGVIADLAELQRHDWYALLGSGLETGVLVNGAGEVVRLVDVGSFELQAGESPDRLLSHAFRPIGEWTRQSGTRLALSITRGRELLVHQGGELRYVYRSGRWRGLPLDVAVRKGWSAGAGIGRPVKRAVLASLIDGSLGHHGACLGIVVRGQKTGFMGSAVLQQSDLWPDNVRAGLFGSDRFQLLSRRQRLELLSMDGATVLDHTGRILAAGAIVAVPGGSSGGGRLAATRALAAFGAAFKVSQDGPIALFGRDSEGNVELKMALA